MKITLPADVILRDRSIKATVHSVGHRACGFSVMGKTAKDGALELWRDDGKWREDGTPCQFDIVGVRTEGSFVALTDHFKP